MRAITVESRTILSGIRKREVLDNSSSVVGVSEEVQSEFNLAPGDSRTCCPEKFVQIKASADLDIIINRTFKLKSKLFIAMSDINCVKIVNNSDSNIMASVIYG